MGAERRLLPTSNGSDFRRFDSQLENSILRCFYAGDNWSLEVCEAILSEVAIVPISVS